MKQTKNVLKTHLRRVVRARRRGRVRRRGGGGHRVYGRRSAAARGRRRQRLALGAGARRGAQHGVLLLNHRYNKLATLAGSRSANKYCRVARFLQGDSCAVGFDFDLGVSPSCPVAQQPSAKFTSAQAELDRRWYTAKIKVNPTQVSEQMNQLKAV